MSVPLTRGPADVDGLVSGSDGVLRCVCDSGRVFRGLPHVRREVTRVSLVLLLSGVTGALVACDWLRVLFVRVAR